MRGGWWLWTWQRPVGVIDVAATDGGSSTWWVIVDVADAGGASISTWWVVVVVADAGGRSLTLQTRVWRRYRRGGWLSSSQTRVGGRHRRGGSSSTLQTRVGRRYRRGGSSSTLRTWVGRRRLSRGGGRRWAVGYEKRGAWSAVVTGSKWREGLTWVCSGDVVVGKKTDCAG